MSQGLVGLAAPVAPQWQERSFSDRKEAEPAVQAEPARQLPVRPASIHLEMIGRFVLGALAFLIVAYSAWFIAWYSGTQSGSGSPLPAPPYAGVISDMSK